MALKPPESGTLGFIRLRSSCREVMHFLRTLAKLSGEKPPLHAPLAGQAGER